MTLLSATLLTLLSISALASNRCPFSGATVEECPAMFYPTPKQPGALDASIVPLLADARQAVIDERSAVETWLKMRGAQVAAKKALDDAWSKTDELKSAFQKAVMAYRDAASALSLRKAATDGAVKNLVDAAGLSYGAKPARTDFRGENIAKGLAAWSPTFNRCETADAATGKCRLRTTKEQDAYRLSDSEKFFATTSPVTGQIVINSSAFDRPGPEEFAATMVHESVHWVDVTSVGGYPQLPDKTVDIAPAEKFDRERAAFLEEAKFFRTLKQEGKARAVEAAAEEFRVQSEITRKWGLTWTDIRTTPKYRAWRGVQDHFRDDDRQGLDFDRKTLRDIQQGTQSLDERLRQDASRRLQEARLATQTDETRRDAHQWMLAEAARCGLEPVDSWNVRYRVAGRSPAEVIHIEWNSHETFKASLLLAAACHSPETESPCNDAMDIITSRWDDEAFRKAIELYDDSHEDTYFCAAHIARRLSRPKQFKKIRKEAKSYRQWLVERRQEAAPKPPSTPQADGSTPTPRQPREPRERPVPPPRGSGNCYWSNDGREICVP